jgi:DNA-binding GntR family transcriptional regulator
VSVPAPELSLEAALAQAVGRLVHETGCTKRSALRLAVIDAIRTGLLRPGDMLPPERRLAQALGISLGTVQAALAQLREAGRVTRRRGDGTRIADCTDLARSIWHFRLCDRRSGQPVFWVRSQVEVAETGAPGPWADFLDESEPLIRVRRRIRMLNGAPVGADMYLPERIGRLFRRMNPTDLALINLRAVLIERFGLTGPRVSTRISARALGDTEAGAFGLDAGAQAFVIDAQVASGDGKPFYFQRVLAGCGDFTLSF